ncbi:MAG: ROK family transcriptional regulator [Dorea sp.]|nr:ROK family transcriptional regulator [Dorea sp.]
MNNEKMTASKIKIIKYLINHNFATKSTLSKELGLSMPTVLSNVNELLEKGLLMEVGELESTGGRKARSIGINPIYARSVGVNITAHHVDMVMVNLGCQVEHRKRLSLPFAGDMAYCIRLAEEVHLFIEETKAEKLLGVGFSIPGIIDQEQHLLLKSHALNVENFSLRLIEQNLNLPCYFENDANAALLAEDPENCKNALYISLSYTLGGAFCIDGQLYRGHNQRAGEFGHMILVPGGSKCY